MNLSEIEHDAKQRRQDYVPANLKVIEVTARKDICTSPEPGFEQYQDGGSY